MAYEPKSGTVETSIALRLEDIPEATRARFWAKTCANDNGCVEWTGAVNSRGYGSVGWGPRGQNKSYLAHRVSFVLAGGILEPSLTIDHICRNRLCVNAAHLEQVTGKENIQRAARLITHCKHGHPLSGENLRLSSRGKRVCRTCAADRSAEWSAASRESRRARGLMKSGRVARQFTDEELAEMHKFVSLGVSKARIASDFKISFKRLTKLLSANDNAEAKP